MPNLIIVMVRRHRSIKYTKRSIYMKENLKKQVIEEFAEKLKLRLKDKADFLYACEADGRWHSINELIDEIVRNYE